MGWSGWGSSFYPSRGCRSISVVIGVRCSMGGCGKHDPACVLPTACWGCFRVAADSPADIYTPSALPAEALNPRSRSRRTNYHQTTSLFEDLETLAKILRKVNVPQIKAVSKWKGTTFRSNRFGGTPRIIPMMYGAGGKGLIARNISALLYPTILVDLALSKQRRRQASFQTGWLCFAMIINRREMSNIAP